jgi:hypothetical protein
MSGPYGAAAVLYFEAGWPGPIPLPEREKWPPEKGCTGADGLWPSRADIQTWLDNGKASGNIALRLPDDVIGVDVDMYDGKQGRATLADLEAKWGPLPDTWVSTSREDGSGIRLYRVPAGMKWPSSAGTDIEIIQYGHRYAMVWPSVHPNGGTYRWTTLDGIASDSVPKREAITDLPRRWVDGLTGADEEFVTVGTPFELPDRIPVGRRDQVLFQYACSLRGKGTKITDAARLMQAAWKCCEQPAGNSYTLEQAYSKLDQAWGYAYDGPNGPAPTAGEGGLHTVSVEEFAAVIEDGARPLLGEDGQVVIAENSDVVIYGDGGAGKTTLTIDLAFHWATGTDWLGIAVPRSVKSLIIENEGPRPLLRAKMNRKLAGWPGRPIDGRTRIVDEPWAGFTLANEQHRRELADTIAAEDVDAVILGPLVCAGMEAAGTLQEVREFLRYLADVRRHAQRRVTFILIHHENRAGKVSGAWEGATDTLLHITGMGHGQTRIHIQKARWASDYHAQTISLAWSGVDGFQAEDKPELSDDEIAERLLAVVAGNPGIGWTDVEKATPGVGRGRRREIRDGLFSTGQLVNIGKRDGAEVWLTECPERMPARLFLPDDPTIRRLRPDPGADGAQTAPPRG